MTFAGLSIPDCVAPNSWSRSKTLYRSETADSRPITSAKDSRSEVASLPSLRVAWKLGLDIALVRPSLKWTTLRHAYIWQFLSISGKFCPNLGRRRCPYPGKCSGHVELAARVRSQDPSGRVGYSGRPISALLSSGRANGVPRPPACFGQARCGHFPLAVAHESIPPTPTTEPAPA